MVTKNLHLGNGRKYMKSDKESEWINIDKDGFFKTDIIRDITKGLPFDDDSIDEIYTAHLLEHISPDDIHFVMREMYRVCKDKSLIKIVVPMGNGWSNFPEHKSPWNKKSWVFFTIWNVPLQTGYNFKDVGHAIIKVPTEIDEDDESYGEELHFGLEVNKPLEKKDGSNKC